MNASVELPQYKSHKIVRAAKITALRGNGVPDAPDLVLGEIGGIVAMLPDWHAKHTPHVGGYFVQYEDGYCSFSPAKAFEEGYTRVDAPNRPSQTIEQEIQAKGLTAPRVRPADLEASIASEHYFTAAQGVAGRNVCADDNDLRTSLDTNSPLHLLTFCVLVLRNGFTVTGESACASPENFDAEIGRKVARENAVNKLWPLMGYALRQSLHDAYMASEPL